MGRYYIYIRLPDEFYSERDKPPLLKGVAIATAKVSGQVAVLHGRIKGFGLRHAQTTELEKVRFDGEFQEKSGKIDLLLFRTEEELSHFVESHPVTLLQRIRVPRIVGEKCYWPPTRGAYQKILELKARGEEITFVKVEGRSIAQAWAFTIGEG